MAPSPAVEQGPAGLSASRQKEPSLHIPVTAIYFASVVTLGQRKCPLLAQSGHSVTEFQCPLLGVKRTSRGHAPMSAFDPKRTSSASGDSSLGPFRASTAADRQLDARSPPMLPQESGIRNLR